MRELFRPYRYRAVLACVISLVAATLALLQPVLVQRIVNNLTLNEPVQWAVTVLAVVAVSEALVSGFQHYLLSQIGESFVLGLRTSLASRLLRWPIREHDQRSKGDLISRFGTDTSLIRIIIVSGITPLVSSFFMIVFGSILMIRIDSLLFFVTVGILCISVLIVSQIGRMIRNMAFRSFTATGLMVAAVERAISSVRPIRASNAVDRESDSVADKARDVYSHGIRLAKLTSMTQPFMAISTQSIFISVLLLGSKRVADGAMTFGDLIGFILFLFLLTTPVSMAMQAYNDCQSGYAAWKRVSEISNVPTEEELHQREPILVRSPSQLTISPSGRTGGMDCAPSITFRNVGFGYGDGNQVLKGVNFKIEAGTWTAIVGQTGSGKSTLLSLLERFYSPDCGEIYLGEVDICSIDHKTLRSILSYVEQDSPALAGSVAENLALGCHGVSRSEMKEVLCDVQLWDFVERSSDGLDTQIGDGGVLLSGGQRQRLAWARAILRDTPVVLMDEPTSSLDAATEEELSKAVGARFNGKTRITISHRLSTVMDADQIIVLDSGSIVGVGTHAELVDSVPIYRNLAQRQFHDHGSTSPSLVV